MMQIYHVNMIFCFFIDIIEKRFPACGSSVKDYLQNMKNNNTKTTKKKIDKETATKTLLRLVLYHIQLLATGFWVMTYTY